VWWKGKKARLEGADYLHVVLVAQLGGQLLSPDPESPYLLAHSTIIQTDNPHGQPAPAQNQNTQHGNSKTFATIKTEKAGWGDEYCTRTGG
jgi:hypothetical protein